ncbi:DNA-binding protein [Stutzerimonas kunmingensis]|uniref:DNA-binding protein n=1 Tax=Stutzerimonas kunmingensis TaxID=1211807 RepID=UPI000CE2C0A2|nr:DNA-binding protein [Stutzerimonas kunmingensis]TDL95662.1 DNA-binding protein [Stutzerimonas stutzeri ATCC 17588 = LMG 11199]
MPATRTPKQAKEWLAKQGKTVQEFAREHSLDPFTCYQVLSGAKKGTRGESHRAAVLLGIKEGVADVPEQYGRRASDIGTVISQ